MSHREPARTAPRRTRSLASAPSSTVPATGITVYGCGRDEAAVFRELAPRFGVVATITEESVSEATIDLASGNRCVSVGHKTRVTNATLLALGEAGVRYISTRSVGYDHIDVSYAESVGIRVENVAYSPDSVADYTLMLMLMVLRNAKSVIRRTDAHDYRLNEVRGKELRDLTVGIVGTGRIGAAVIDRLWGSAAAWWPTTSSRRSPRTTCLSTNCCSGATSSPSTRHSTRAHTTSCIVDVSSG